MPAIASFHLIRERPWRAPVALARLGTDRLRLRDTPGLGFWRLLGTGDGADTGPGADPRRTALFAVWDDESDLDRFLGGPIARRWEHASEAWHVRLRARGGHGTWRGVPVLTRIEPASTGEGPVAIITRADVRLRSWRAFRAAGRPVSDELATAEGLLAVCGIGEAPVGRLGTFSLWRGIDDARHFARSMPEHLDVVRRTREERWYGEELFARFEPYGSSGTWDGRDPLASVGTLGDGIA